MIKTFTYRPKGTCSVQMKFAIETSDDTLVDFDVFGGCPGNLGGIKRLIIGMKVKEIANKLEGVTCASKPTSCPDQLSVALHQYLAEKGE